MTNTEFMFRAMADDGTRVQFLSECALGAKLVKRTKGSAAYTRVEFATQHMTPNDLMGIGQASHVGVIVWIPIDTYRELVTPEEKS